MMRTVGLVGVFLLVSSSAQAQMPSAQDIHSINGSCTKESHTAEGPIGSDLTRQTVSYKCDQAELVFFPNVHGHVMISFVDRRSHRQSPIGFAGMLQQDGLNIAVDNVYLIAGSATPVSHGSCKFWMDGRRMKQIFCYAVVDDRGQRTTAVIGFDAARDQFGR